MPTLAEQKINRTRLSIESEKDANGEIFTWLLVEDVTHRAFCQIPNGPLMRPVCREAEEDLLFLTTKEELVTCKKCIEKMRD